MNKLLFGVLVVAGGVMSFSSCSDEWDDHYAALSPSAAGPNLWETLKSNPDYSVFVDTLARRGYDAVLSADRVYTVFAPTNQAMQNFHMNGDLIDDEFIKNHIAYFYHNVYPSQDTTVTMLNEKVMRIYGDKFGDNLQPTIGVIKENIPCQNGLLQVLDGIVPYKPNIWEYVGKQGGLFKDYLYSYNRTILNTSQSTPGYVNDKGETVYLDSVTYISNQLWGYLGSLNNEDSTYVSFVLDNNAWEQGHARVEENYMYYPQFQYPYFLDGSEKLAQDSLVRLKENLINLNLIQDLNFRKSVLDAPDNSNIDYYRSTAYGRIPKAVVNDWKEKCGSPVELSNGLAYKATTFEYEAPGIWQDTLVTEGEDTYRLLKVGTNMVASYNRLSTDTLSLSPLSTDYEEGEKYEVSEGRYVTVKASSAQVATATFGVSNTLSGKYDIWVTFIPAHVVPGIEPKPSSVRVSYKYCVVNSRGIQPKPVNIPGDFALDPYAVTRIRVAENVDFGVCFLGFLGNSELLYTTAEGSTTQTDLFGQKYGFSISFTNATRILDKTTDHNLYIDNIELVPHREN